MTKVVLTRKMLDMIRTGIHDRETICYDELSNISFNSITDCDKHFKELKKRCEAELKLCDKVTTWAISMERKRGYHD